LLDNRSDHRASSHGRRNTHRIAMSSAYRLLLWADCVYIAVIVPAALGMLLILRLVRSSSGGGGGGDVVSSSSSSNVTRIRDRNALGKVFYIAFSFIRFAASIVYIILRKLTRQIRRAFSGGQQGQLPLVRSMSQIAAVSSGASASTRYTKRTLFFGSLLGLACSFASLRTFGIIVTEVEDEMESWISLKAVTSQICALGVVISSILAGFGSVSMPYTCLVGLYLPQVSDHAVLVLQEDYSNVLRTIDERKRTVEELQARRTLVVSTPTASTPPASADSGVTGFFRNQFGLSPRANSSSAPPFDDYQATALMDEIAFLETLSEDLKDEVEEMRFVQNQAKRARTLAGRVLGWVGVVFSIVLLVRVGMAVWAVVRSGAGGSAGPRTDPITLVLGILTGYSVVDEEQYNALSQLSSLLLTGFLSISQVRMFLRTVSAINRRFGCLWKSCGGSDTIAGSSHDISKEKKRKHGGYAFTSSVGAWLLSAVMGSFFLCCLVLMKMNLPREYRSSFSSALKGFDFAFDLRVTNAVFAFAAVLSAVILGVLFGIRRQTSSLHASSSAMVGTPANASAV